MDCCEDPMAMCRVVCPKPRRVAPPTVIPSRFHIRNDAGWNDGAELLGLIFRQDPSLSSPLASPPCRSQNPVVQDADFGIQIETETDSPSSSSSSRRQHLMGKKLQAPPDPMLLPLHTNYSINSNINMYGN